MAKMTKFYGDNIALVSLDLTPNSKRAASPPHDYAFGPTVRLSDGAGNTDMGHKKLFKHPRAF